MQVRSIAIALAMLALAPNVRAAADLGSLCRDCQLQVGIGGTYHFWSSTGGVVIPVTLVFDQNKYEVGVFRMANQQSFYDPHLGAQRRTAEPYWGASASRRWQLVARPSWNLFFGFGASYKTERDELSVTRWNFASQLGVRLALNGRGSFVELAVRHWSNAGIRLPNRGQDFATMSFVFSPAQLGTFASLPSRAQEQTSVP